MFDYNTKNNRARCEARNLSCCYDNGDGEVDDFDYDRKRRRIDDSRHYCCDRLMKIILGYDQVICIPACHNNM